MTKQYDELVARLREVAKSPHASPIFAEAADAIARLGADLDIALATGKHALAAQAQEIAELRACVKAADHMRYVCGGHDGNEAQSALAYDAARSQLNPKDAP